ncbi:phytoene/squalene synthase family protein [Rhodospirillum centenum]|uniref:Squalene n=1 Tax=Rhodospirillum centenum (strain ATCC 51521 / SW) TaxID=414684 RepID=B6ISN3_RHOCS|nr:squalene/phytoene synthase family protein [Rhodospirillum centenum]ACI98469.1 squalene [Rhodospirillum centenum SW]
MAPSDLSYCADQVRRFDNDRFLTALFAPADRREDLFALYACNLEVAKTREVVSEATLGLIRLQWWRDALEGIGRGEVRRHEVVEALAGTIGRHGLDSARLDRLIEAREADLEEGPPASLVALTAYAEATAAPLAQLALEVLGVRQDAAMEAARHAATAWALTGVLRAVPFHASHQRLLLPADLMACHGVPETALFAGTPPAGLAAVVQVVAEEASRRQAQARALRRQVPAAALPALLTGPLCDLYLTALAKAGFDPFAPRMQMPHPLRQLRLGWAALTGRW